MINAPGSQEERLAICRLLIAERTLVGAHFGFDATPSPTWDVLLDLYLAHQEGRTIYLWSLCVAANIPMSSAHRKITELVDKGWLCRSADQGDGRRVTVGLTPPTLDRLDLLLDAFRDRCAKHLTLE
ncbi:hypothetical protein BH10PSE12_BH10PSE12_08000 [soil metagenome]